MGSLFEQVLIDIKKRWVQLDEQVSQVGLRNVGLPYLILVRWCGDRLVAMRIRNSAGEEYHAS